MAPRRSPPPSKIGSGVTCRRSPRFHPQIPVSEDGAGVGRRLSPRLHPQFPASEYVGGVASRCRRGRGTSPAAHASLPDDDDMLREILLRLPPQPSSLPRASAVCKRWRGLVTDAGFLRQFYAHHRKPPILGVFEYSYKGIVFNSVLDPPDRIPGQRFNLGHCSNSSIDYDLLDCRHGRVLVEDLVVNEVVVCNPVTGEQRRVPVPPEVRWSVLSGAVLCADTGHGHVHGGCNSSPFKVVLVSTGRSDNQTLVCVYSSETAVWGNAISIQGSGLLYYARAPLIGNCLYWLCFDDGILEFDLDMNRLNMIMEPPITNNINMLYSNRQIIRSDSGVVGFAMLCYPHFHMWQRNINAYGVATWTPWKTIDIHSVLGLPPRTEGLVGRTPVIRGYDEDTDVICVNVDGIVYMVHLKSIQSSKPYESERTDRCHLFKSFYTQQAT
ncbi:unnamed protein product [Alopecurus aequalis]